MTPSQAAGKGCVSLGGGERAMLESGPTQIHPAVPKADLMGSVPQDGARQALPAERQAPSHRCSSDEQDSRAPAVCRSGDPCPQWWRMPPLPSSPSRPPHGWEGPPWRRVASASHSRGVNGRHQCLVDPGSESPPASSGFSRHLLGLMALCQPHSGRWPAAAARTLVGGIGRHDGGW